MGDVLRVPPPRMVQYESPDRQEATSNLVFFNLAVASVVLQGLEDALEAIVADFVKFLAHEEPAQVVHPKVRE